MTQLVLKFLLQLWVIELHNSMVSTPEEGIIKEARDIENIMVISDSTLCNISSSQLKEMTAQYKVMCGFGCCILEKSLIISCSHGVLVI